MIPIPKASDILQEVASLDSTSKVSGVRSANWDDMIEKVIEHLNYKKKISTPLKVLDHGFVRLVDYMGNDLSIVRSARVSYNADWRTTPETHGESVSKDEKLISYLLHNKHTSPFESVVFTFEICCPLFVARQWHRHRTWSYNEVSARYTELPELFYIPNTSLITTQAKDNKQARTNDEHPDSRVFRDSISISQDASFDVYRQLLEKGCPRELARLVLPQGTYTRFFGTVNLHNLFHFLKLRIHTHAQYEIRVYAEALLNIIENIVPVSVKYWRELNDTKVS